MSSLQLPLGFPISVQQNMQTTLDSFVINFGRSCILYYPPLLQQSTSPLNTPYGETSSWSQGNPQPVHSMQGMSPYADSVSSIAVEQTGVATMVVYWTPSKYDPDFPRDTNSPNEIIRTRGMTSDLPNVINCTRMETYRDLGTDHYKFKLVGRPIVPGKIIPSRYFFAWWQSV